MSMSHLLIVDDDVNAAMSLKLLVANEQVTVAVAATLHKVRGTAPNCAAAAQSDPARSAAA